MTTNVVSLYADEPEFGDGDGEEPGFDECEACGGRHFRALTVDELQLVVCADCAETLGWVFDEEEE